MRASVASVRGLMGLNATFPKILTQISSRMWVVIWQRNPEAWRASAIARQRADPRAIRFADRNAMPLDMAHHAGLGDLGGEIDRRSDHAPGLDGRSDGATRVHSLDRREPPRHAVLQAAH